MNNTFETPVPITALIDLSTRSNICVIAEDRADTTVEIKPRSSRKSVEHRLLEQLTVDYSNGLLQIILKPQHLYSWFDFKAAVNVTVRLPRFSNLTLGSGMGNLRCEGDFDSAELRSGHGEIRIDRCASLRSRTGHGDTYIGQVTGPIDVSTGNGTLRIGSLAGDGVVKTANGDVYVSEVSGRVRLKSAHGNMVVGQSSGEVELKTSNGNLRVEDASRGTVTLRTAHGALAVGVREGTAAWLDLNSQSGSVHNELGTVAGPGANMATLEVVARTSHGDITIRRAAPGVSAAAA